MRLFWFVLCTGLLIFYFVDKAVKVDSFTVETLLNNLYHFFAGFIFLAGMFYLKMQHKFRWFVILFLGILVLDEIYDLSRGIKDTSFITIFFNSYLLIWGGVSGLAFSKKRVVAPD